MSLHTCIIVCAVSHVVYKENVDSCQFTFSPEFRALLIKTCRLSSEEISHIHVVSRSPPHPVIFKNSNILNCDNTHLDSLAFVFYLIRE